MTRLLICIGDGIGNMIMATPMISAISQMECEVDVLGSPNYSNSHHIFKGRPEVRQVLDGLSDASEYDCVIATVGGRHIPPHLRGIKKFVQCPADYAQKSEIENNMDVARLMGWNLPTPDTFCGMASTIRPLDPYTIALHNGKHKNPIWHRKSYPRFRELVSLILEETDYIPVIFGTQDEHEDWMDNPNIYNFCGKLDILHTAGNLNECAYYIGTDSGLAHMAAALDVDTNILWGPTSILKNKPPKAKIIQNEPICEPCQEFYPDWEKQGRWAQCGHWVCMEHDPRKIIESILNLSSA